MYEVYNSPNRTNAQYCRNQSSIRHKWDRCQKFYFSFVNFILEQFSFFDVLSSIFKL